MGEGDRVLRPNLCCDMEFTAMIGVMDFENRPWACFRYAKGYVKDRDFYPCFFYNINLELTRKIEPGKNLITFESPFSSKSYNVCIHMMSESEMDSVCPLYSIIDESSVEIIFLDKESPKKMVDCDFSVTCWE